MMRLARAHDDRRRIRIAMAGLRWRGDCQIILGRGEITIWPTEIVGIMGPSGVGKSSLFKAVVGWLTTLTGSVSVTCDSTAMGDGAMALLPQDSRDLLLPWYSIGSNWHLAGRVRGLTLGLDELSEMARAVGLASADLEVRPRQLSGGEQRRAALAMALLRGGSLLLLDEPFSGLDTDVRAMVLDLLHVVVRDPGNFKCPTSVGAVLLIAHGIDDVAALCDRVVICKPKSDGIALDELRRPDSLAGVAPSDLIFGTSHRSISADWETSLRLALRPEPATSAQP